MPAVVKSLEIGGDSSVLEGMETPSPNGEGVPPSIGSLFDNDQFVARVAVVQAAIEDPVKMRQCIAEIHTYLSLFDEGFRNMGQEMAMSGGPFQLMKKLMGMGRG